jgi:hypothetical protein
MLALMLGGMATFADQFKLTSASIFAILECPKFTPGSIVLTATIVTFPSSIGITPPIWLGIQPGCVKTSAITNPRGSPIVDQKKTHDFFP